MNNDISSREIRTVFVVVFTFMMMMAEMAAGAHMGAHVIVIGLNWEPIFLCAP